MKHVNSETVKLRDFSFILSSTFICEPIFMKICLDANLMNTQIFVLIKFDLKSHRRLPKVTFMFKKYFLLYLLCRKSELIKTLYE